MIAGSLDQLCRSFVLVFASDGAVPKKVKSKNGVFWWRERQRGLFFFCVAGERELFFFPAEESGEKIGTRSFLLVNTHTLLSFFSEEDGMRVRFVFRFGAAEDTVVFYISLLSLQCEVVFGFSTGCVLVTHTSGGNARMLLTDQHESSSPPCGFFLTFFLFGRKKTTRRDTHTHTHHGEKKKTFLCFFPTAGVCVCCGVGVVSSSSSPSPTLCFLKYRQYPRIQK